MATANSLETIDAQTGMGTRFHLSLNVNDLDRTVGFFRDFFGVEPAKQRADYAKFELDDPPLVLSLEPVGSGKGGNLNHLGFRVSSAAALVEMEQRLEAHGIRTQREEGVECCYARQTKFWLHDPDGNLWEVYTLDGDLEHRGMPAETGGDASRAEPPAAAQQDPETQQETAPAPAVWMHRIGQPLPERLFVHDETVDEAHLQGSFNVATSPQQRRRLLAEVLRALRPGGRVTLHMLTADRRMPDAPLQLPGPASVVKVAPLLEELVREVQNAGFTALRFEKLGDGPCFVREGAELRETILVAEKPTTASPDAAAHRVCYKGPFDQIRLDGRTLRRGEFAPVDDATYRMLQITAREQFVFPKPNSGTCGAPAE